jgi:NADH-quinone oxidoreductase subunit L
MVANAWLVPLFPFVAYLLLLAIGKKGQEAVVALIGVAATAASLIVSLLVLADVAAGGTAATAPYVFDWLAVGKGALHVGFAVTPLNAVMLVVVSLVSMLVLLFSKGYMHGDPRFGVFYQYLSLFVFSMLALVISPNFLQLYIFWELVGLCSYLLVGFWYFKPEAAEAAKKSFVVTRLGDIGLLIGIILLYAGTGTFDFSGIFAAVREHRFALGWIDPNALITLTAILVFIGAVGKSAQFPLHVWLPDAMEGPTPVSALIHAATMVAAGVYLVARSYPLFQASPDALAVVAWIGGITALLGASIGLTQHDIKRVIAYSTISQLGYMMMALGVSAYTASVFHLFTHAFFKALLFLAAGSVIHSVDTQDLRKMGGLWKKMPVTGWTFLCGALALAGIFPFAGFWSKDDILSAALAGGHVALYVIGLVAAFFTAFYIFRVFFLAFAGEYRGTTVPQESGPVMTVPLVALAVMAVFGGFFNAPVGGYALGRFLDPAGGDTGAGAFTMVLSTVVGLLGILTAGLVYGRKTDREALAKRFGVLYTLSYRKFYFDEIYDGVIVRPLLGLCGFLQGVDQWLIDGLVRLAGRSVRAGSSGLRYVQNGQVQTYGLLSVLGLAILLILSATVVKGAF